MVFFISEILRNYILIYWEYQLLITWCDKLIRNSSFICSGIKFVTADTTTFQEEVPRYPSIYSIYKYVFKGKSPSKLEYHIIY